MLMLHTVINKDSFMKDKLSLDVLLPAQYHRLRKERPSEEQLKKLSNHLYKIHKGKRFERVFICYYLLGMSLDHGAWATGHFLPELQINIIGDFQCEFTEEPEQK